MSSKYCIRADYTYKKYNITFKNIQKYKTKYLRLIYKFKNVKYYKKALLVFEVIEAYKLAKMRENEILKSIGFIIKAYERVKEFNVANTIKEFLKECEVNDNEKTAKCY